MKQLIIFSLTLCLSLLAIAAWGQTAITKYGTNAGASNTTGDYNSFFGFNAGQNTTTGTHNTFNGAYAGALNTLGSYNSFLGVAAGYANTTGHNNSFIGMNSGRSNTTGANNSFLGVHAGYINTTGYNNSFTGTHAGFYNTTGSNNSFVGMQAGLNNTTGSNNVFLGYQAGYNETSSNKLYIANSSTNKLIYGDFATNQVGINTTDLGTHTLNVNGTARAKEILVEEGWGDYVFHPDYQIPSLEEEAQHIQQKGHLSGFQSAEEMNGEIGLGDVTKRQQVKIEELMLHVIEINNIVQEQNKRIEQLEAELKAVKAE